MRNTLLLIFIFSCYYIFNIRSSTPFDFQINGKHGELDIISGDPLNFSCVPKKIDYNIASFKLVLKSDNFKYNGTDKIAVYIPRSNISFAGPFYCYNSLNNGQLDSSVLVNIGLKPKVPNVSISYINKTEFMCHSHVSFKEVFNDTLFNFLKLVPYFEFKFRSVGIISARSNDSGCILNHYITDRQFSLNVSLCFDRLPKTSHFCSSREFNFFTRDIVKPLQVEARLLTISSHSVLLEVKSRSHGIFSIFARIFSKWEERSPIIKVIGNIFSNGKLLHNLRVPDLEGFTNYKVNLIAKYIDKSNEVYGQYSDLSKEVSFRTNESVPGAPRVSYKISFSTNKYRNICIVWNLPIRFHHGQLHYYSLQINSKRIWIASNKTYFCFKHLKLNQVTAVKLFALNIAGNGSAANLYIPSQKTSLISVQYQLELIRSVNSDQLAVQVILAKTMVLSSNSKLYFWACVNDGTNGCSETFVTLLSNRVMKNFLLVDIPQRFSHFGIEIINSAGTTGIGPWKSCIYLNRSDVIKWPQSAKISVDQKPYCIGSRCNVKFSIPPIGCTVYNGSPLHEYKVEVCESQNKCEPPATMYYKYADRDPEIIINLSPQQYFSVKVSPVSLLGVVGTPLVENFSTSGLNIWSIILIVLGVIGLVIVVGVIFKCVYKKKFEVEPTKPAQQYLEIEMDSSSTTDEQMQNDVNHIQQYFMCSNADQTDESLPMLNSDVSVNECTDSVIEKPLSDMLSLSLDICDSNSPIKVHNYCGSKDDSDSTFEEDETASNDDDSYENVQFGEMSTLSTKPDPLITLVGVNSNDTQVL